MAGWVNRYRVAEEPLRSERRVELLLLTTGALLCLQLLYSGIKLATLSAPPAVPPAAESLEVATVGERADVSESESELLRSRPLFWRTRRPTEAAAVAAVEEPEPTEKSGNGNIDKVKLRGVFGSGDSAGIIALVNGKKRRIRVGDTVEGWTLVAVKSDRGIFDNAGRKFQVMLKRIAVPAGLAVSETE